jgi:hypothetical protein
VARINVRSDTADLPRSRELFQPPQQGLLDPERMYDVPPGSDPRYLGAAPDRSDYTLVRASPPRGVPARLQDSLTAMRENRNGIRDQMIADIRNGQKLGGDDWYNTEELRDWFMKELGPERGDSEWRDFMRLIGATSTGNKVPSNIRVASHYRNKGPEWIRENAAALEAGNIKNNPDLRPPPGYGHKAMDNHAANVARMTTGEWDPLAQPDVGTKMKGNSARMNAKPRGFENSLMGNPNNIAADLHFTRYMAIASGSPEWLGSSQQVSAGLKKSLIDKYGDAVAPYFSTKKVDGKPVITYQAMNSVKDGVVKMDDIAHDPTVFAGKPNDNEYKAFEDYMREIGKELGMTAPQVQANLWMGAAQRTGLADESQGTFMELFRKVAEKRAKAENMTPAQVIKRFIRERGLLEAGGGLVAAEAVRRGGLLDPEEDDRRM